jgi:hypothetical protein
MHIQISIVCGHCVNLNDYLQLELVCPSFYLEGFGVLRFLVAPYVAWVMYSAAGQCFILRTFCVSQEPFYMLSWRKWCRLVCLAVLCTARKLAWACSFSLLVACVTC